MSGRLRSLSIATAIAVCAGAAFLPPAANAGPVKDVLGGIQNTINDTLEQVDGLLGGGSGGGGGSAASEAGPAPAPQAEGGTTEPGISGTNPHAQGEVLDLTTDAPILDQAVGTVVLGQSRGEQDESGDYHGNVTVLSVSGLGLELSFPTDEGETETSPLDPLNQMVLDGLCDPTGICLGLLEFESSTDDSGSSNSFSTVNADIGDGAVTARVLESEGNIGDDGSCQNADSSSTVTNAGALGLLEAEAIESESHSEACNDGTEVTQADSEVANLTALGFDLGGLVEVTLIGCESGDTVDDPFSILGQVVGQALVAVLSGVCNGDDTNGAQAESPYNVRKALGADVLEFLEDLLGFDLSLDVSTSESLAQAPGEAPPPPPPPPPPPECPDPDNPDCPDDPDDPNDPANPDEPGGPSANPPEESLPFTGADLGRLGAIGLGVMALGLGLMALADRRRRELS